MTSLGTTTLYGYPRGDEAKKTDGTAGAISDTLGLQTRAVAIMIIGSGTLAVKEPTGATRTIADGELAKNMWHPMEIAQVLSTGTTLAASGFRLGYARY